MPWAYNHMFFAQVYLCKYPELQQSAQILIPNLHGFSGMYILNDSLPLNLICKEIIPFFNLDALELILQFVFDDKSTQSNL